MSMVWFATSRVPMSKKPMDMAMTNSAKPHDSNTLRRSTDSALRSMASTLRSASMTMS